MVGPDIGWLRSRQVHLGTTRVEGGRKKKDGSI